MSNNHPKMKELELNKIYYKKYIYKEICLNPKRTNMWYEFIF